MKLTKILTACGAMLILMTLALSCTKKTGKDVAKEDTNFSNKTLVQVFDATVNSASTHVFVDNNQVTGTALAYGSLFPSSSYAFQVDGGLRSFSIRSTAAGTTQTPINFSENMLVGKNYTIFTYDTTTSAKQLTVLNDIVIPSDTTARVKFANFIHNSSDLPGVDVFSVRRNENIFTNIKRTQVTDYIPYAAATPVTDTLLVRETGTTNLLTALNGFNPVRKRSYTLIYRGSYKGTRALSSFTNY
jgi:hypothetical protein